MDIQYSSDTTSPYTRITSYFYHFAVEDDMVTVSSPSMNIMQPLPPSIKCPLLTQCTFFSFRITTSTIISSRSCK